jgi:hypothetical protein
MKKAEDLGDCAMSPQMHSEGREDALASNLQRTAKTKS